MRNYSKFTKIDSNDLNFLEPIRLKGYSEVWKGTIVKDHPVIIKIGPWVKHEAEILKLNLTGFPKLFGFFPEYFEGKNCIVIEELPGEPLNVLGARLTYGEWRTVLHGTARLMDRVSALLGNQFIHGDLTTDNVIVDSHLKPHLIDLTNWGTGQRIQVKELKKSFSSPEVIEHGLASQQSDMFSLAASSSYLMGPSKKAMLEAFLKKCLAPDPEDRPGTWKEVLSLL